MFVIHEISSKAWGIHASCSARAACVRACGQIRGAERGGLQDDTLLPSALAVLALFAQQGGASGVLKDFSNAVVGFGGAFEVVSCAYLLLDFFTLYKGGNVSWAFDDDG